MMEAIEDNTEDVKENEEEIVADASNDLSEATVGNVTEIMKRSSKSSHEPFQMIWEVATQVKSKCDWEKIALDNILTTVKVNASARQKRQIKIIVRMMGFSLARNFYAALEQAIYLFDDLEPSCHELYQKFINNLIDKTPSEWTDVKHPLRSFKKFLKDKKTEARRGHANILLILTKL